MDRISKFALNTVEMNSALQEMLTTQMPSLPFMSLDVDETRAFLSHRTRSSPWKT